ncbi:MAG: MBL fold metallo-hydrolase, partial [Gammaproteobacteria bacterium]|nr:MBL fold metallo-hydrolase [Gammaproteobacteria bacterium]
MRTFCLHLLSGLLLALSVVADATAQAMPARQVVAVGDGIYAATGYASNNMGFVVTTEGVVVIDTGMTPALGREFLAAIREVTDQPIRYVIFTHYHYDHVDGASAFQGPGTEFVAHENLVRNLRTLKGLERVNQSVLGAPTEAPTVYPDVTYRDATTLTLGGREIRLYHAMGETDDATLVYLPQDRVMFIGDLNNANLGSPVMPEGYPEGFMAAVDLIAGLAPDTLVPGHGRIEATTLASLQAMSTVTAWLMAKVRESVGNGNDLEATLAAITLPPQFAADPVLAATFSACREPYINRLFKNYTGYYGSNPVYFRPVPMRERSALLAELAGGNAKLLAAARRLSAAGEYQLALELLDLVTTNDPGNRDAHAAKAQAFG